MLQVKSQPPMVLLSTHTHCMQTHTQWGARTIALYTAFPDFTAWLDLSLQKTRLTVWGKFSSHSSEGQEHYLHLHLCQPPPPFPRPLILSLDFSALCSVRLTAWYLRTGVHVTNGVINKMHQRRAFKESFNLFFFLSLFEVDVQGHTHSLYTASLMHLFLFTFWCFHSAFVDHNDWKH